jgi:hypothetical protein
MQQEVTKYRPIVRDDGSVTQKQLLLEFMTGGHEESASSAADPEHDYSLVPRLVNAKQFDVIQFRRRVRRVIETERIRVGRPIDGSRTEKYKYYSKHVHAKNRVREKGGSFANNSVSSICDIIKLG